MTIRHETQPPPDAVAEFCRRNAISEMPRDAIADFCRRHRIRTLATFADVTRDIFELGDNDIYVDFKNRDERRPESKLNAMQDELRDILGVEICLKIRDQMSAWLLVALYHTELLYDERN